MAQYIVDWCETKTTSTGKNVKNATLKTENGTLMDKVSIWSDFPGWADIRPGSTVQGEIRSNPKGYKSLSPGTFSAPAGGRASGAVSAANITKKSVEEAQARKSESIAFFNSTNNAIALLSAIGMANLEQPTDKFIVYWRDWFLSEYRKYEAGDITDKTRPF